MSDHPARGVDTTLFAPLSPQEVLPVGGASRGGNTPDDAERARRLRALATEIETLPTTHAAFARLLNVGVEVLQGAGAWLGLIMEDSDALVVVAAIGDVPVEAGTRVPRERAFAARALRSNSAVFADPSTGVRWSDTVMARVPVRAVAAPLALDGEPALGVISIIGGPGRLFTVADGSFAHELGTLAALVLRRRDNGRRMATDEATAAAEPDFAVPAMSAAAAAVTVDDFASTVINRLDDEAFLGISIAVCEGTTGSLRFPAALGALGALRGVRTPLEPARAEFLARQRRAVQMPDARHLVPEGWRSLVPALPGASIALIDNGIAVGRIDIVFDPDRAVPDEATRRIEQRAGTLARALTVLNARIARTPTDHVMLSLHALRDTIATRLHDVTAPIAGISALAELLAGEQLSDEVLELVTLIQRSTRRATDAARTLRSLADQADLHPDPVAVDALVHEILRERADTQNALAIVVTVTVDPLLPPLAWPTASLRDWIASAIVASETALLSSARRRIDIRAGIDGAMATLTVADDGAPVGIVSSEFEHLGATVSVIRTDDGRTIRRLAIPLRVGTPAHLS